jgi:alkanesulfonate monooxygenase SsuD/methylene tetrahydromethanopterin reductase-like flavin-dependent oxidoreductase (luciferase family)
LIACHPTSAQAQEYYRHCIIDHADWSAVDAILAKQKITRDSVDAEEFEANGMGGSPIVGDPDFVAQELANLSKAGLKGIGVSFVNYGRELPYFVAEVLLLLERLGLREPQKVLA